MDIPTATKTEARRDRDVRETIARIQAVLFYSPTERRWSPTIDWNYETLDEIHEIMADAGFSCPDDQGVICTSDNEDWEE